MANSLSIRDLRFRYRAAEIGPGETGSTEERSGGFELAVSRLDLDEGEQLLLTGSSGGGKSTLLQIVAGLRDPDAGSVLVGGADIHALRGAARDHFRGQRLGMIFQTFHLAQGFTALENVLLALLFGNPPKDRVPQDHRTRARELLERLHITRSNALVESLSVGQQQRVAVARALACHPALVLADEPTASLDPENADRAVDLLRTTCREQGAALLVVSHDPSLRGRFDRHVDLSSLAGAGTAAGTAIGGAA
ncbi:MAG: ABC transporter ATP-binding protein [Phycisphaerales bacterium]